MRRLPLLLTLLAASGVAAPAAPQGFVAFTRAATQRYEFGPDQALRLAATGPSRDPEDHAACGGRVFGVAPLLHRLYRLGPDLQEDRTAELGAVRELVRLVGADDQRVFVFFDNTLAAYDAELKPAGRVKLDPGRAGEVVPVISVDDCLLFDGHAYLLASNTGDVFAVDLKAWTAARLHLTSDTPGAEIRGQWIDPEDRTLNVLVARSRDEHPPELAAAATRVIKEQVVRTYALGDLAAAPREAVIYEEREIHKPYPAGFMEEVQRKRDQGIMIDFPPPYRSERPPRGLYVRKATDTAPCFADVMVYDGSTVGGFGPAEFVVLRSAGRTEKVERFRDEARDVLWFKSGGVTRVLDRTVRDWRLRLQPAAYAKLLDLPGLADAAVLAY